MGQIMSLTRNKTVVGILDGNEVEAPRTFSIFNDQVKAIKYVPLGSTWYRAPHYEIYIDYNDAPDSKIIVPQDQVIALNVIIDEKKAGRGDSVEGEPDLTIKK